MQLGMIHGYGEYSFDYVKSKGLSFIEVCRNSDNESENFIGAVESVKRQIDRTGVRIGSVGRWNSKPNAGGRLDEDVLMKNIRLLDAAHQVQAPVFVCGCNYDAEISLYRNYTFAIEYFSRMLEETDKRGMKLAVYNCSWENFIYSPAQWDVVMGELPSLMIKYDASHAYYRNADYLTELDGWCGRIAHTHIKGAVSLNGKRIDDPPAGMDNIDWQRMFALLYKHGYDGGLSIEPHSDTWRGELGERGVDFTINYIRPFLL
jgi:sugar phosphate isomerase/epimerase